MATDLAVREDGLGWDGGNVLVVPAPRKRIDLPETRLMAAVLESAIAEWLLRRETVALPRHPRRVTMEEDLGGWFASTDRSWPYSFENLCLGLGLDAAGVRRRLRVA